MSRLFAHGGASFNTEVNRIFYHDGNDFSNEVNRVWAHDGAQWTQIFPGDGNQELPSGTYILGPTSQFLGTPNGYSEYDTVPYRGRITEIRARVSWRPQTFCTAGLIFGTSGRPNGNFYRNITSDASWCGRTIDHRIDSFDATSIDDFNNGAAIGFSYSTSGLDIGAAWSNVSLNIVIV